MVTGVRPIGRPFTLTVASSGALWKVARCVVPLTIAAQPAMITMLAIVNAAARSSRPGRYAPVLGPRDRWCETAGGSARASTAGQTRGRPDPTRDVRPVPRRPRGTPRQGVGRHRARPARPTGNAPLPGQRPPTQRAGWLPAPRGYFTPSRDLASASHTSRPASRSGRRATTEPMNARSCSAAS